MRRYRTILIAGPTASGKSGLALRLAEETGGIVINADSMQVYQGIPLITAQPSPADMARVPHLLYGHRAPGEAYSTGAWLRDAAALLDDPARAGPAILVGGTGLYFKALTEGLAALPPPDAAVRARLRARLDAEGAQALHAALARMDAAAAARLEPADGQRILRALEVIEATGRSILDWQGDTTPGPVNLDDKATLAIVLDPPRDALAERIATRFSAMIEAGALDEVAGLRALKLDPKMPAMKAIGVPELGAVLDGVLTLDEGVERAVIASRQYAKRQRTWFRGQMGAQWRRFAGPDADFSGL